MNQLQRCFHSFLLLLCTLLAALSLSAAAQARSLQVVASFSILGDWVQQVGGEHVQVTLLVKAGEDAHVFEPSAQDARTLAQADLLFINSLGFEPWVERLKTAAGFKGVQIIASQGIAPRVFQDEQKAHALPDSHSNQGNQDAHDPGQLNPHAWQDVRNTIIYVQRIEQALSLADPAHAAQYQARAQAYIAQLQALDQEIRTAVAQIPENHRIIVTNHDSLGYFASAYGFTTLALSGLSTNEEPSAAHMAQLIVQIRKLQIPALFLENATNAKLMERIAHETSTTLAEPLYVDALSAPGTPAGTYIGMMQSNLRAFIKALCPAGKN